MDFQKKELKNKIFLSFFHPIYRSYSCPKKQNMGDFLLFTTSVAHIPGANISFTVGICDAGLNHSGDWS